MKTSTILSAAALAAAAVSVDARGSRTALRGAQSARKVTETTVPTDTIDVYCDSMRCPDNRVLVANAHAVECVGGECEVDKCCDAPTNTRMCSVFTCPADYVPNEWYDITECPNGVCNKDLCCSKQPKPRKYDGTCGSYACPIGFSSVDDADYKKCKHDPAKNSSGGGRRRLRGILGKGAEDISDFSWWSASSAVEEDFCDTEFCCRKLEHGLWGLE